MDRPSKSRKQNYGVGPRDLVLNQFGATQMDDSTDYGFEWLDNDVDDWDSSRREEFKMSKRETTKGWNAYGATLLDNDGRPIRDNIGRTVRENLGAWRRVDLGTTGETRLDVTHDSTGRKTYGGRRHEKFYYPYPPGPARAFSDEPLPPVKERVLYPGAERFDYAVDDRAERRRTSDRILMEQWHDMFGRIRTQWSSNSGFNGQPVVSYMSRAQSFPDQEDNYDKRARLHRRMRIGGAVCIVLLVAVLVPTILLTGSKDNQTEEVLLKYEYEVTVSNRNYSEDMANSSSEAFTAVAEEFCDLLDRNAEVETNEEFTYQGCAVTEITNGSLVIRYTLIIVSVTTPTADQVSNVVGITVSGDQQDVGDFTVSQIVTISAAVVISEENSPVRKKIPYNTTCSVSNQERCLTRYSECIDGVCSCPVDRYHDNATDECTLIDCGAVPLIDNGTVMESGSRYGSVLNLTCEQGYVLSDNATVNCSFHGTWGHLPSCEPVKCHEFIKPNYSDVDTNTTGRVLEDRIEITCTEGYSLDSNTSLVVCQADKSWSKSPECVPIICEQFQAPENSMILPSRPQYVYNENINVECDEGYQLVGNKTLGCRANGKWIETPTCEPIDCEPLPFLDFAVVPQSEEQYVYNENVTIVCKTGYKLNRNESVSCQTNSSWTNLPSCTPIECEDFVKPVNSDINSNATGQRYGDLIKVTCQSGYTLIGEYNLSCNTDGTWPAVYCTKINCTDNFISPRNSIVIGWNESTSTFEIGCEDGYNIVGNSSVTCLNNATWSISPVCEAKDCGNPSDILNAVSIGLNSTTFNSRFSVECNEGYYSLDLLIVTCQSNGTWSKFPTCDLVSCGNFAVPEFARVTVEEGNTYGKNVTFECIEGYRLVGNSEVICQQNGSWTSYPVCQIKDCGQISVISDGIVFNETGTTFGSMIHIKCYEGFDIVGNDFVTCLSTGKWEILPSCLETDCGNYSPPEHTNVGPNNTLSCDIGYEITQNNIVECIGGNWSDIEGCKPVKCNSFPIIDNANTLKTEERTYVFGDTVEILCNDGFEITGSSEAYCGANRTWENVPKCQIVTCEDFSVPSNAVIGKQETKNRVFEDEILVNCTDGYSLTGNRRTICGANREWLNIPTCTPIDCNELEIPNSIQTDNNRYKYNESVTVKCISGYILEGVDKLRCSENGTWIDKPTCIPKRCEVLEIPNSKQLTYTSEYMYNESITITCNSGYVLEGNHIIKCLENGSWINIPTCTPVPCDNLNLPNASLKPDKLQYMFNETVIVTCNHGYSLKGNITLICFENGSWIDIPTCNPVPCDQLNISDASLEPHKTQFKYNESVNVTCNIGYTLKGNDTLKCLENGTWINIPTCNPVPCNQLNISNASLEPNKTQFKYNELVSVTCNIGYTLEGNDTLKCLENGSWIDIPTCNPVLCEQLNISDASLEPHKSQFKYNESVNVTCNIGYTLKGNDTLKCLENGTWINIPTCNPVPCNQLNISNASLEPNKTQFKYNKLVSVTCNIGYTLEGNDTLKCLENGSWIDIPTCNPVHCDQLNISNASLEPDQIKFLYNDTVIVKCNIGYTLEGNGTLNCFENGSWIDIPTCNPVPCDQLKISNASLEPNKTQFKYNESVSVTCNVGYTLEGNGTLKCLENGSWIDISTCNPVSCDQFNISIASLEPHKTQFKNNESVSVTCNTGYTLEGNDTLKCLENGSWIDIPTCNPVPCNQLNISNASLKPDYTQFKYNESVSVTCNIGYTLEGNDTLKCVQNGSWIDIPTCNPVPCDQLNISNASLEPKRKQFEYNESVSVTCNIGYTLEGNDTLKCVENGSWIDIPTCTPVPCDQLNISNASLEPQRTQFKYNESVSVTCNIGYTQEGNGTLKCLANGSWIDIPTCNPVHCDQLNISNASLEPDQINFLYNETIRVKCNIGYTLEGNSTLNCFENGSWIDIPTCNPVPCNQLNISNASLEPNKTQFKYNESVSVTCNIGYTLEGNDTLKCLENGSWIDIPTCNTVPCDQLNISNASLEPQRTQFKYNELVSVTCNIGYTLKGNDTLKCFENGSWIDIPTCNPVHCDQLNISNASLEPDQIEFLYNETVRVKCNIGYKLEGNGTLNCFENGSWIDKPTCNPVPCNQLNISNASLEPNKTQFKYSESVSVTCNIGYTLEGNDRLKCLENGLWIDIPTCNPVPCNQLNISNASLEPQRTQFKYNESVSVTCNTGYTLEGNDTLKCLENGSWIDIPTCNPVPCNQLNISNALLDPNKTQFRYNESVSVTCNIGYTLEGNDTLKCLENGSWIDKPTCNPVPCNQLNISNASLEPNKTQFKYNELVSVTCNIGYTLEGNDTLKCLENGSWIDIPKCNPVHCDQLNISNASLEPDQINFLYNDTVIVKCNIGYTLEGNGTLNCFETGSWIDIPTCNPVPCDQLNISNASLEPNKTQFKYNESVSVTCNIGYTLEGNGTLKCLENGSWIDIPTCNPVPCVQLSISNALLEPHKTQFKYNESVSVTCNTGYTLEGNDTLKCAENGSWIDIPTCNPVPCNQLNISNASLEPNKTQFEYNESVSVTCNIGYTLEGNDTLKCFENGSWIDIPTCNPVPCNQLNISNASLDPNKTQFEYNESVSVTCNIGYTLEGNDTLKCLENGSWIDKPTCNPVPCNQLNISNASLEPNKTQFKYNELVSVTCNIGYTLEGNDTLKCLENGSWIDIPKCNPVHCDQLNISNASLEPDQIKFLYNDTVIVKCNIGYTLEGNGTLNCFENGSWIDIPTCNPVPCDQLNISNASLEPNKTQFKYSESVSVTCNIGYTLEGNDTLKCAENGSWIDIPTCNPVPCNQLNISNASLEPNKTQFEYNESVSVTCNIGYTLEGNDTLKCFENGSWIDIPTCNPVPCNQLNISNASLDPNKTQFEYNESVSVTCNIGYTLEGNDTLKCLENGSWIDKPTCNPVPCNQLNISNASLEPNKTQFKYNELVSVTCNIGYTLEGNDTLKCLENGSWIDIPKCNPVHCDQLNISNASLEPDQITFLYNDTVIVKCNIGYTLEGNGTLNCFENGSWIDIPTCNPVPCDQLNISNASLEPNKTQFKYSESVSVTCNIGYTLEGNGTLKCLENGSWIDIPTCNPVPCVQLSISNALLEPHKTQFKYNESVSVTCNTGYTLEGNDTLKCVENGSWIDIPTCNPVPCNQLNISNASLDPNKTQFEYNESVSVACNIGYTLEGNDTLKCLENGSWIDIPTCNPVPCDQLNISNASLERKRKQFKYNESVSVTCNIGYTLEGNDSLKCLENGSWIDIPTCNPVHCDQLNISNALLEPDQIEFLYNETVIVKCNIGYTLEGNGTLNCFENGSWIDIPMCNPVPCDQLNISNASLEPQRTLFRYNESVSVTCNIGYTLKGNDTLKCIENGSWIDIPTCNPVPCNQLNISNASLEPNKTQFKYNELVSVTCNIGYTLEGNDTLKCLENGSWIDIPKCNPVHCDQLNISNASLEPDQIKFLYNDTVIVKCNIGYTLEGNGTLNCFENGSWIDIPTCNPVPCDQLNISNASLEPNKTQFKYSESVSVTCNIGYTLEGNDTLKCAENGSWIDIPTCNPVPCNQLNISNASLEPNKTQFEYNESVSVTCNIGYTLEGNDTLKCFENGSWIDIPTCNPVPCNQLNISNASLDPNKTQFEYNESVSVTCNIGYTLEGNDTLKCLENGSWIDIPTCNPVPCNQLNISNASLEPNKTQFKYNELVSVTCNIGYTLEGNDTLKCLENGSWIDIPKCNPVHCDQLNISNASLEPDQIKFLYNDTVIVKCNIGYTLEGNGTLNCFENGSWIDIPTCNPVPCDQLNISNASLEPNKTQFKYSESVSVTCNIGYTLEGNGTLKCLENGSWIDIPTCNPVPCVQLSISNALLEPHKTQFKYNESVSVTCNTGYTLEGNDTLKCVENGSWIDIPTCNPVPCNQLNISNASLDPNKTQFEYNESVSVACNIGYTLEGNDTLKCLENGSWIDIPTCNPVPCDQLNISNASLERKRKQFKYNESVSVTCNIGYTLEGNDSLKCLENGSWIDIPTCNPVHCDQLNISNALLEPDQIEFLYNETVIVKCNIGYTLEGNGTLNCFENGSWIDIPMCNPVPCDQLNISNASLEPQRTLFRYNESVSVTCNIGYTLKGNDTLKCIENGSWIDIPTCNPVPCNQLNISNASLEPNKTQFKYNESVSVTCNIGYTLEGNPSLKCLENGSWKDIPTCNPVPCNQLNISKASLEPNKTQFKYNELVSVTCNIGYTLEGNDTQKCLENGSWIDIPTCNPVHCEQLNISNASLEPDQINFLYNDTVIVKCITGYTLEGNSTLNCFENGSWIDIPTCNPVPCDQLNISNASLEPNKTQFKYNESVSVTCNYGYILEGNDSLKCLENGSWIDIPTCKPVHCDQLNISNASLEPDQIEEFLYNETVRVKCNIGYTLEGNGTLNCLQNGSWIDIPTCNPVPCNQLNISNASLEPHKTQFNHNESVSVTCNIGYSLEGNDSLKCLENGSWIDIPTCTPSLCDLLHIENADVDPKKTNYTYNENVTVQCMEGYQLEGNEVISCIENGTWINSPMCIPVRCEQLSIENAAIIPNKTEYTYNENVTIRCEIGYALEGDEIVNCAANRTWGVVPLCIPVKCELFNLPENAFVSTKKETYVYNENVTLECRDGYEVEGDGTISCQANTSWSKLPICKPITCEPFQLQYSNETDTNYTGLTFEDDLSVSCNKGFILVGYNNIRCNTNGTWPEINCVEVNCSTDDILKLENSVIVDVNERVPSFEINCIEGYQIVGNSSVTCLAGNWSEIPTCEIVNCGNYVPTTSTFVVDSDNVTTYNSSLNVTCIAGLEFTNDSAKVITCGANGQWNGVPVCSITGKVSFTKDVYSLIKGEDELFVCDVTDYPSWQTVIVAKLDINNTDSYIPIVRIFHENESIVNETLDDNYITEISLRTDGVSVTVMFKESKCDDEGIYICAAIVGDPIAPIEMKEKRTNVSVSCPDGCGEYIILPNATFNLVQTNETTAVNKSVIPVKCIDGLEFTNDSTTYVTCGADRQWAGQPECKIPGNVSFTETAYSFEAGNTDMITCEVTNYSSWQQVLVAKLVSGEGNPIVLVKTENGEFPSQKIFDNSYSVNATTREDGVTVSVILNPSACTNEGLYTCAAIVGDVEKPVDIEHTRTNVIVTPCP